MASDERERGRSLGLWLGVGGVAAGLVIFAGSLLLYLEMGEAAAAWLSETGAA